MHLRAYLFGCLGNLRVAFTDIDLQCLYILEGTLIGAVAGNILPEIVVSALGIAIYGMFLAIIIPPAKKSLPTALCILFSVALSCAFRYIPVLKSVPDGFVIIICAVAASALFAIAAPVKDEKEGTDNEHIA